MTFPPDSAENAQIHQAGSMSLLHCPLCVGLAVLSALRAASHLSLVWLRLAPTPEG
jgi:hypothetical protein